jgi:hypothetical protein
LVLEVCEQLYQKAREEERDYQQRTLAPIPRIPVQELKR